MWNAARSLIILGAAWLAAGFPSPIAFAETPEYVETVNGERKQILDFLKRDLRQIEYDDETVRFVSAGRLGIWQDREWTTDFALREGDRFQAQPDHHATIRFEVRRITRHGIDLGYTSMFDHRSFGRNTVSIDRGKVFLNYR